MSTPLDDAQARFWAHTATVDDLLLLAIDETQHAIEALPPHAVAPLANNCGGVHTPDPYHASACALRANMMLKLARRRTEP